MTPRTPCDSRPGRPSRAAAAGLLLLVSGCGLPTWSELIGAKKEEPQPVVVPVPPPTPTPPPVTTPQPPPPPSPAEVIAAFQAKPSYEIDDNALNALLSLPEGLDDLRVLNLNGAKITAKGLQHISNASNLLKLDARNTSMDANTARAIATATSLEELRLDGGDISDAALQELRPLQHLRVLEVNQIRLSPAGWAELLNHPALEELMITQSNINDEGMLALSKCTRLRRLGMNDVGVSDLGLAQLGRLDALEHLNVSGCPIRGEGFRGVSGSGRAAFLELRELVMQRCPLNEKGAAVISQMKHLRYLNLGDMPTMRDQDFIRMIRPLKELQTLQVVNNTGLTGQCLNALKENDSIEKLVLGGCTGITDVGLGFLTKCSNLKEIHLADTGCTLRGALALKQALPQVEIIGISVNQ